ncbi:phosphatase PAP2/dual specificity phosphatase family protein [Amphritea sp.]|uniref:phosphatase PAP2/dual specificity phosphatase family protein n=1 Tax=Amphritea sp. TaxID=1872502 RepID=UPI0025BE8DAF|nr:phosphatase PAP2/dual specificity phosphatase family protein [Amphritea sp.]
MSTHAPITCEQSVRPWLRALTWLIFLGPTFFISYGFANEFTAGRNDIGQFVFAWETLTPFWDWTIIPYMSIDLLYGISLFLCISKAELDRHCLRLLAATLISVTCFLLFPLEFTFPRPQTEGFYGFLFDLLTSFDKPYNQAPSLHISLLVLIWCTFSQHIKGSFSRLLMHTWMLLIGISVMTTWQHHFIDVIGGLIVALLLLYFIPSPAYRWKRMGIQQYRLTRYYLLATVIFSLIGIFIGGWGWLLLWPATATTLVALAYCGFGTSVFQYHDQRMSLPALILLTPYLLGAYLSAQLLSRKRQGCVEVTKGVWLSQVPGREELQHSRAAYRLNLTAEMLPLNYRCKNTRRIPMLDLAIPDEKTLRKAITELSRLADSNMPVLVHCALGLSRSAVVIAGWLISSNKASSVEQAVQMVAQVRPDCILHDGHRALLNKIHLSSVATHNDN